MKKNYNFPILLVVIVLVAVVAQLTRQSGGNPDWQLLRKDMVSSLTRLWEKEGHQVELVPAGDRLDARVSVSLPRGLRLRQQRWNYPFLRFVAARHPAVSIGNLHVVEAGSHRAIPEVAMAGLVADRVAPRANFEDEEERLCQLTGRQLTGALERKLGPGRALVLVDAQEARSYQENKLYGRRAYVTQPPSQRVMVTEVCLVVSGPEIPAADWEQFRAENSLRLASFRVVTLPGMAVQTHKTE
ncbi:MAG: hypothetical protein KF760_30280 [Candidatus Eremiobacteraeota bacterium]|nr:hypothetical protein [Candidatus Eremiobacteraeota bacterium]MCW5868132.1 hypothetical protein [Candidatus Eremiobacteraeota bacterium]